MGRRIGSVHCLKPCFLPQEAHPKNLDRHGRIGDPRCVSRIEYRSVDMVLMRTAGGTAVHRLAAFHGRRWRNPKISREPVSASFISIERSCQRGEYGHDSNDNDRSNNDRFCRQFEHVNRWGPGLLCSDRGEPQAWRPGVRNFARAGLTLITSAGPGNHDRAEQRPAHRGRRGGFHRPRKHASPNCGASATAQ